MNKKPLPPEITAALTADPLLVMGRDLGQIDDADYKSLDEQQRQRAGDLDTIKLEDCAVNYNDRRIIVPPDRIAKLREGMAVSGPPLPSGSTVKTVGNGWFEISELPTMTWFGDLIVESDRSQP